MNSRALQMYILYYYIIILIETWKAEQSAELQRCQQEAEFKALKKLEELGRKHKSFQDMLGRSTRLGKISNLKPNEDIAGKVSTLYESFLECNFDIQQIAIGGKRSIQLGCVGNGQVM